MIWGHPYSTSSHNQYPFSPFPALFVLIVNGVCVLNRPMLYPVPSPWNDVVYGCPLNYGVSVHCTCHNHQHVTRLLYLLYFGLNWTTTKGQLITKANCQAEDSSKKRTNEFVFTSMQRVFVRFLKNPLSEKNVSRLSDL